MTRAGLSHTAIHHAGPMQLLPSACWVQDVSIGRGQATQREGRGRERGGGGGGGEGGQKGQYLLGPPSSRTRTRASARACSREEMKGGCRGDGRWAARSPSNPSSCCSSCPMRAFSTLCFQRSSSTAFRRSHHIDCTQHTPMKLEPCHHELCGSVRHLSLQVLLLFSRHSHSTLCRTALRHFNHVACMSPDLDSQTSSSNAQR